MLGKLKLEQVWLISLLLVLAVVAVYLPVVGMDFTNYDDPYYVTENQHVIAGLNWDGVSWAWTHFYTGNWHPLTWVSHMADCQIYGIKAAGHHLTNLLFHAANSVLVFLLLRSLTGAFWRSACVAALFAVHPLHVESVAWISERKDVLSAFFGLLSLWAYVAFVKAKELAAKNAKNTEREPLHAPRSTLYAPRFYVLSLVCFAVGLMSKPMLVTWPFVMLVLDYWPLRRLSRSTLNQRLAEKIPFLALSATSCVVAFLAQRAGGGVATLYEVPLAWRLLNVPVSYVLYLGKLAWPADLAVIYPYVSHRPVALVLAAAVVILVATLLAIWQRERRPYLAVGWAWFLGTLVPVIGLVQVGNQSIADRYSYLPAIGWFLLAVWGAAELVAKLRPPQTVTALGAAAVMTAYALAAQVQVLQWQNTETLFRHTLAVTSNNFIAWNSLGFYYADFHETKQAQRCFQAALAINPYSCPAWNKLASLLIDQGRYDEAIADCRTALRINPQMAGAHSTLGLALMRQGKPDEAIAEYREATRLEPDFAPAHYNLANALAARGQIAQAREQYQEALRSDPRSADAHNNLAFMLVREGKLEQAVAEYGAALALMPGLWQAQVGLADLLARQGRFKEGSEHYREALRQRPDSVDTLNRLAWLLAAGPDPRFRDGTEAVHLAERACKLTGYQQAGVVGTLAVAYAETGRFADAVSFAEKAQDLAVATGQKEFARRNQERLEMFRAGRAYHEAGAQR